MPDNIHPTFDHLVGKQERQRFLNQKSSVFWFTGLSGSGKSTIAQGVERLLFDRGYFCQVLDGDNIRSGINDNLGFSLEDRKENIRRISEVAKLYYNSGIISICSFISPTLAIRGIAEKIIGSDNFYEIYINTPLEICEQRDVKGLYKKARSGSIKGFTGIDSPYEAPIDPKFEIKTVDHSIKESCDRVMNYIIEKVRL